MTSDGNNLEVAPSEGRHALHQQIADYDACIRLAAEALPARPISLEGLDVLRRIQTTGELAHLVLTFGPHAGESLG